MNNSLPSVRTTDLLNNIAQRPRKIKVPLAPVHAKTVPLWACEDRTGRCAGGFLTARGDMHLYTQIAALPDRDVGASPPGLPYVVKKRLQHRILFLTNQCGAPA